MMDNSGCGSGIMFLLVQGLAYTLNTFITSSPRWLITLTAIRPEVGFSKGRDVSLWRVDQASALISALRVVFNAVYGSFWPRK